MNFGYVLTVIFFITIVEAYFFRFINGAEISV